MEQCRAILEYEPHNMSARLLLGRLLIKYQKFDEGAKELEAALESQPENIQALTSLSWMLATDPKGDDQQKSRALALASQANELTQSQDAEVLDVLAVAHACNGDFELAIKLLEQVKSIADSSNNRELLSLIDQQRLSFDLKQPWTNRMRQPGTVLY